MTTDIAILPNQSAVVKAMARAMAEHAKVPVDIGHRIYLGHAHAALTAILPLIQPRSRQAGGGECAVEGGVEADQR